VQGSPFSPPTPLHPLFPTCFAVWGAFTGQDPFSQNGVPNVDFITSHLWPTEWRTLDFSWATAFLLAQQVVAARLNKPLLLEEVRLNLNTRFPP
jgi:hypothetical protein